MPVPQPSVQSGRYISTNCRRTVFTSLHLLSVIESETRDISDKALQVVSELLYQTAISPLAFTFYFFLSVHPTDRPRNQFQSRNGPFLPRDRLRHSCPWGFDACCDWRKNISGVRTREIMWYSVLRLVVSAGSCESASVPQKYDSGNKSVFKKKKKEVYKWKERWHILHN